MQGQILQIYKEVCGTAESMGWRRCRECLCDITNQSYFSRIWILQELVFSYQVRCLWGSFEFGWDIIDSFAKDLPVREALAATLAFKNMPAIVFSKRAIVEEADKLTSSSGDARASALEQFSSFHRLDRQLTRDGLPVSVADAPGPSGRFTWI
jgi:hypothetical protein